VLGCAGVLLDQAGLPVWPHSPTAYAAWLAGWALLTGTGVLVQVLPGRVQAVRARTASA
jgi:hypothetical protein